MVMLTNSPTTEHLLRWETSKSFSFRMGFVNAAGQPVDMTGAELRLTAVDAASTEKISKAAVLEDDPVNGVFRFDIQPVDVNIPVEPLRYNITLRTPENYIVDVMMGDLELVQSASIVWADQTYTAGGAVETLNVIFGGGPRITLQTDDLPAPDLTVTVDMLPAGSTPYAEVTGAYPNEVIELHLPEASTGAATVIDLTTTALAKIKAIFASAHQRKVPVCFYGDSVTEGFSSTRAERAWVSRFAGRLQAAHPSGIYRWKPYIMSASSVNSFPSLIADAQGIYAFNFGNFGQQANTFVDATRQTATTTVKPEVVFVAIGINDYGVNKDPALFETQLETALQTIITAAGKQIPIVIVSMYPRSDGGTHDWTWDNYADAMGRVASAVPAWRHFVDLRDVFTKVDAGGADPYDLVYSDNIHLSDRGHAFVSEQLAVALQLAPGDLPIRPIMYDTFQRAALGNLETGQAWANDGASVWAPVNTDTLNGSYLECTTAGYLLAEALHSNVDVEAVLLNNTIGFAGIAARSDATAQNVLLFQVGANGTPANSAWQLLVRVAGSYTTLASGTETINAARPIHLELVTSGDNVKAYLNGKSLANVTLTAPQHAALTSKRVGVRASASTQNRVLQFSANPAL